MRNLIFLTATLLFLGCSLKTDVPVATMYEIHYSNKACSAENKQKELKNVFIENVSALDMVDTRKILIVAENNKIRYLSDAKFVALFIVSKIVLELGSGQKISFVIMPDFSEVFALNSS